MNDHEEESPNNCIHDAIARQKMFEDKLQGHMQEYVQEYVISSCANEKTIYVSCPDGITLDTLAEPDLLSLISKVIKWHYDRNLINGSTDKDQALKLLQELGELSDNICKGRDISDDLGDMLVVMLNIAERNKVSIAECLERAWNDIKDRKGKMVDGIFVKESDL